jgi:hypothetical protein
LARLRAARPQERQDVPALELTADQYVAVRVDPVNLENRLCDVETV